MVLDTHARDERNVSNASSLDQVLRNIRQELAINAWLPRKPKGLSRISVSSGVFHSTISDATGAHLSREEPGGLVHHCLERIIRHLAEALKRIRRAGAVGLRHEAVIVVLAVLDRTDRSRRARLHERAAEEALGVAAVRDHLERHGDRAGADAPAAEGARGSGR